MGAGRFLPVGGYKKMENAKLKILFRIPWTIYWVAFAVFNDDPLYRKGKQKYICLATKEYSEGEYNFFEISGHDNIDCL